MLTESRSFLRDRASTETTLAAQTDCGPAAWSHAHLARLYLERCIETVADTEECVGCEMNPTCISQEAERRALLPYSANRRASGLFSVD
ncbi:hypothetical protein [Sphingomonas sp.]|uniref:hypothetical protein n=1 Tax=Sphingomonas sp. TaxID=28214 RepID=UPI0025FF75CD|nr:hypothetical protein [Sphingomonas sp.]